MRFAAGVFLIVTGLLSTVAACFHPWVIVRLRPPARYHYYYIPEDAKAPMATGLVVGVILIGVGSRLVWKRHPNPRDK